MNGTLEIWDRRHLLRSSSNRPASAPTFLPPRRGSSRDPDWYCRLAVNGFVAVAMSRGTSRSLQECSCPAVAYSSGIQSRLGYSPNGVFDAAYHTTTGKSRSKTNNGLDKKSRPFRCPPPSGLPPPPPAPPNPGNGYRPIPWREAGGMAAKRAPLIKFL
jgi:hypothetical protein